MLVIPTVPGPPPHLQADVVALESFRQRAFSMLSIAGFSGFCQVTTASIVYLSCGPGYLRTGLIFRFLFYPWQVSIPLGLHENLPVSVSLVAKHGSDGFLLSLVDSLSKFT